MQLPFGMPSRFQDLVTRLIAKDDASKVIGKVADLYDDIPDKVGTTITAEDKATPELRKIVDRLDGLSKEDQMVVLRATATDAQRGIDRLLKSLTRVHEMDDEEVRIRISALDQAKGDLDRVQREIADLDGETAEVRVEATGLDGLLGKLESLPGKFGAIGGQLSSALGPLTATGPGAAVGAAAAIAGGLLAAANHAADLAIEAQTTAKLTGDTVENVSKVQQLWRTTGADVNDLNDIVVQLNGALQQSPELAANLGINLTDGRTALERFLQVVDLTDQGLVSMTDQSTLFGEEGIRQVAALTTRYDRLASTVAGMEPPVSKEDAANALKLKQSVSDINTEFQQMAVELGQEVIPALAQTVDLLEKVKLPETVSATFQPLAKLSSDLDRAGDTLHVLTHEDVHGTVAAGLGESAQHAKDADAYLRSILGTEKALKALSSDQEKAARLVIDAIVKGREEQAKLLEDQTAARTELLKTDDAVRDLAGAFEQMGVKGEALQSIFALGNAPLDAAGRVRDIAEAIDGLSEAAEGVDLSAPLDPSNVDADALLDRFDSLRPQIQAKIVETFEGGGTEAATKMAQDYIAQVSEELGISPEEAAHLLGLDDIQATIHVAVEQSDVENARRQLEILTGVTGETPFTASIALALDAGTISGADAQRAIQALLKEHGVTIPAELVPGVTPQAATAGADQVEEVANPGGKGRKAHIDPDVDPAKKDKTKQDLDETAAPTKPRLAPIYAQPLNLESTEVAIERVARDRISDVYVVFHYPDGTTSAIPSGGGGGGGGDGGPFLAPTMLGAAATVAPVGTVATVPVAVAPSQRMVVQHFHQNFSAGAFGDTYDIMRAVDTANRQAVRLMPKHP